MRIGCKQDWLHYGAKIPRAGASRFHRLPTSRCFVPMHMLISGKAPQMADLMPQITTSRAIRLRQ